MSEFKHDVRSKPAICTQLDFIRGLMFAQFVDPFRLPSSNARQTFDASPKPRNPSKRSPGTCLNPNPENRKRAPKPQTQTLNSRPGRLPFLQVALDDSHHEAVPQSALRGLIGALKSQTLKPKTLTIAIEHPEIFSSINTT